MGRPRRAAGTASVADHATAGRRAGVVPSRPRPVRPAGYRPGFPFSWQARAGLLRPAGAVRRRGVWTELIPAGFLRAGRLRPAGLVWRRGVRAEPLPARFLRAVADRAGPGSGRVRAAAVPGLRGVRLRAAELRPGPAGLRPGPAGLRPGPAGLRPGPAGLRPGAGS